MSDLQSMWAESAWRRLVESRQKRNRRRGIFLLFLAFSGAALIALFLLRGDRLSHLTPLTIQQISVTGNRSIPTEEILGSLPIGPGSSWWSYRPSEVRCRVEGHPRIRGVSLHYEWFHCLRLDVEEREPTLTVVGPQEGELTEDGWFLPLRGVGETLDLPVLRLAEDRFLGYGCRADEEIRSIARLVERIRSERYDLWQEFSEIVFEGALVRLYLRSPCEMILFVPEEHEELWHRVPAVLADLRQRGRRDAVLDLRFEGRIVVHLPDGSGSDTLSVPNRSERV